MGSQERRHLAEEAGASDPKGFANLYAMIFEGVLVVRQVEGHADTARVTRSHVAGLVDSHLPRRGRGQDP